LGRGDCSRGSRYRIVNVVKRLFARVLLRSVRSAATSNFHRASVGRRLASLGDASTGVRLGAGLARRSPHRARRWRRAAIVATVITAVTAAIVATVAAAIVATVVLTHPLSHRLGDTLCLSPCKVW
jgi:hypothetical protein